MQAMKDSILVEFSWDHLSLIKAGVFMFVLFSSLNGFSDICLFLAERPLIVSLSGIC